MLPLSWTSKRQIRANAEIDRVAFDSGKSKFKVNLAEFESKIADNYANVSGPVRGQIEQSYGKNFRNKSRNTVFLQCERGRRRHHIFLYGRYLGSNLAEPKVSRGTKFAERWTQW